MYSAALSPVEEAYEPPTTLPKSGEIRTSLLDAQRELSDIERRLTNARVAFIKARGSGGDTYLSYDLKERAKAERWQASWPEFDAAEREAMNRLQELNTIIISTAQKHVDQLSQVETIPAEAYAEASRALPFVEGEIAGIPGARLAQRLAAVSAISNHESRVTPPLTVIPNPSHLRTKPSMTPNVT